LIYLSSDSALKIIIAFYCAIILSLWGIGYAIHWMAGTYGSITTFTKGYAVAAYGATPLFIAGLVGFYPLLWLDLSIGVLAVAWGRLPALLRPARGNEHSYRARFLVRQRRTGRMYGFSHGHDGSHGCSLEFWFYA
jgi:uncharacterized membrane protein (Fun14 family)